MEKRSTKVVFVVQNATDRLKILTSKLETHMFTKNAMANRKKRKKTEKNKPAKKTNESEYPIDRFFGNQYYQWVSRCLVFDMIRNDLFGDGKDVAFFFFFLPSSWFWSY